MTALKKITPNYEHSALIETSVGIVDQLIVGLHILSDVQYQHIPNHTTSPIGGHVRHIIEFYQAFFKICTQGAQTVLCYDDRARDMRLETSKETALTALKDIKKSLSTVPDNQAHVLLSSIVNARQPMISIPTTYSRELFYLLDHTIHHMALIKMIASMQGLVFDQSFGLAQSTKAHEALNT